MNGLTVCDDTVKVLLLQCALVGSKHVLISVALSSRRAVVTVFLCGLSGIGNKNGSISPANGSLRTGGNSISHIRRSTECCVHRWQGSRTRHSVFRDQNLPLWHEVMLSFFMHICQRLARSRKSEISEGGRR